MLLFPTYLEKSPINGFGVFTSEEIPPQTLVWEFFPKIDLQFEMETFAAFPKVLQEYLRHYGNAAIASGELHPKTVFLLCGDNARFMNHSETPNISSVGSKNFSLRLIKAGEEITCNYQEFDLGFDGF